MSIRSRLIFVILAITIVIFAVVLIFAPWHQPMFDDPWHSTFPMPSDAPLQCAFLENFTLATWLAPPGDDTQRALCNSLVASGSDSQEALVSNDVDRIPDEHQRYSFSLPDEDRVSWRFPQRLFLSGSKVIPNERKHLFCKAFDGFARGFESPLVQNKTPSTRGGSGLACDAANSSLRMPCQDSTLICADLPPQCFTVVAVVGCPAPIVLMKLLKFPRVVTQALPRWEVRVSNVLGLPQKQLVNETNLEMCAAAAMKSSCSVGFQIQVKQFRFECVVFRKYYPGTFFGMPLASSVPSPTVPLYMFMHRSEWRPSALRSHLRVVCTKGPSDILLVDTLDDVFSPSTAIRVALRRNLGEMVLPNVHANLTLKIFHLSSIDLLRRNVNNGNHLLWSSATSWTSPRAGNTPSAAEGFELDPKMLDPRNADIQFPAVDGESNILRPSVYAGRWLRFVVVADVKELLSGEHRRVHFEWRARVVWRRSAQNMDFTRYVGTQIVLSPDRLVVELSLPANHSDRRLSLVPDILLTLREQSSPASLRFLSAYVSDDLVRRDASCAPLLAQRECCLNGVALAQVINETSNVGGDAPQNVFVSGHDSSAPEPKPPHPCVRVIDGSLSRSNTITGLTLFPRLVVRNDCLQAMGLPDLQLHFHGSLGVLAHLDIPIASLKNCAASEISVQSPIPSLTVGITNKSMTLSYGATALQTKKQVPVLIPICVHQSLGAVKSLLENIAIYASPSIVILHIAREWNVQPRHMAKIESWNGTVHPFVVLYPYRYRMTHIRLVQVQLRLARYFNSAFAHVPWSHVLFVASNEMFVKPGVVPFLQQFDVSFPRLLPGTVSTVEEYHVPHTTLEPEEKWTESFQLWNDPMTGAGWLRGEVALLRVLQWLGLSKLPASHFVTEGMYLSRPIALHLSLLMDRYFNETEQDCDECWMIPSEIVVYSILQRACAEDGTGGWDGLGGAHDEREHPEEISVLARALRNISCGPLTGMNTWRRTSGREIFFAEPRDVRAARCSPFMTPFSIKRVARVARNPIRDEIVGFQRRSPFVVRELDDSYCAKHNAL